MTNKQLEDLKEQLPAALATWQQSKGSRVTVGWLHVANPEVIAMLLTELEDKPKGGNTVQQGEQNLPKVQAEGRAHLSEHAEYYTYFKVEGPAVKTLFDSVADNINGRHAYIMAQNQIGKTGTTYLTDHYGIMQTGFGAGDPPALLTTCGGFCPGRDDCLLFAVPRNELGYVGVPDDFQTLTYAQFYDLVFGGAASENTED